MCGTYKREDQDAMMLVLPSDHLIRYEPMYIDTLKQAISVAEQDNTLVTIGITPTYAETGYGYINFSRDTQENRMCVYKVNRFVEKPDIDTAKKYLASGDYLWNSGMFVWKVSSIMNDFARFLPETYEGLERIEESVGQDNFEQVLRTEFEKFKSESIDFGIMEKSDSIYVVSGSFGWDDVGSWLALERINTTNEYGSYVKGDVITINTKRSIVSGGKRLIAMVGVEDMIVVDTDDTILICAKDSAQDIKKVIENLKICNRTELI